MFVQHSRNKESFIRKGSEFVTRCLERPEDPGVIKNIPHVVRLGQIFSIPITLYTFDLTLTPHFCFIKGLNFRCNTKLKLVEADTYLFLDMVLDYFQNGFMNIYKRKKLAISSDLAHFAELTIKKGFHLNSRTYEQEISGWRAIKNVEKSFG